MKNDTERNRKHKTKQNTKCLRTQLGSFPAKLLAIANELGQRETQMRCYKAMLLTGNPYKIT